MHKIAYAGMEKAINNRFRDDYSWTARLNTKGRVVDDLSYTGDYYVLDFSKRKKLITNVASIGFSALLFMLQLAAGMVNQTSSRTFWIVYPYIFTFLPVAYFFVGAVGYCMSPVKMQKAHYETGIMRMKRSCIGSMVMNGISIALDIVFIITRGASAEIKGEIIYIMTLLSYIGAAFVFAIYFNKTFSAVKIEKNTKAEEV